MKVQTLWYIRRGGQISGPFPANLISRAWLLGRYRATDEASSDQVSWAPLDAIPDLRPHIGGVKYRVVGSADAPLDWLGERRAAALRWHDERHLHDRRDPLDTSLLARNRRAAERRVQTENPEWTRLRQRHAEYEAMRKQERERFIGLGLGLLVLLAFALLAALKLAPVNPIKVDVHGPNAACAQAAAAQVDWTRCDKSGTWLQGADLSSAQLSGARFNAANLSRSNLTYANLSGGDLSFANLSQAKLNGANLNAANLLYADLRNADLRYADLRNANLIGASLLGARLDEATWVDGRTCAAISVGECQ
jgi:uncharacterized protein YjbI with pentapeptide repeats